MKYLIVVLVVALVLWMMLRGRRAAPGKSQRTRTGAPAPTEMVQCSHCGLHLPGSDAVQDNRGVFCTEAHRLAGPRSSN